MSLGVDDEHGVMILGVPGLGVYSDFSETFPCKEQCPGPRVDMAGGERI